MLLNRFYYQVKPWIPHRARLALRRLHARRIRRRTAATWPILESAARKPAGWTGWPDAKQFAFVLTHDVEGPRGLANVKPLAELEMSLGFRSAFYFIPEGSYTVPPELRAWLTDNGFEVGVHDLHHDGKLFRSREGFRRHAQKINRYLEEWGAVGFRAGFMMRQLDWLHDLHIQYDASTFDTDPFEPQPDGVNTIFPFWVPRRAEDGRSKIEDGDQTTAAGQQTAPRSDSEEQTALRSDSEERIANSGKSGITNSPQSASGVPDSRYPSFALRASEDTPLSAIPYPKGAAQPAPGYVELPYTLPQDSTLFLLLGEPDESIWTRKLDWIAGQGGMVMFTVHPDYIGFGASPEERSMIALTAYTRLLGYVRDRYAGRYWAANPAQLAQVVRTTRPRAHGTTDHGTTKPRDYETTGPRTTEDSGQESGVRGQGSERQSDSVSAVARRAKEEATERQSGSDRDPVTAPHLPSPVSHPLRHQPPPPSPISHLPSAISPPQAPHLPSPAPASAAPSASRPIWIDLDNTPHVPFFLPIIAELESRGYTVWTTARDAFQVCEMADLKGVRYTCIGRHYGKVKLVKLFGLFYRAAQLWPHARRIRPLIALSHGARSQAIASNLLGIPVVMIADYEFAQTPPLMRPTYEIVPDSIPADRLGCPPDRVRHYPGIKEDVYAWTLRPDAGLLTELGVHNGEIVVVVRPPATEAHYHNPDSERLFEAVMNRFSNRPDLRIILLPRNQKQASQIVSQCPAWFGAGRVTIPQHAVDGLNLLYHSDLVISGGGTMNREAAALGVPVYSIFRGKTGAVDRYLQDQGRLLMLETPEDVERKIRIERRRRTAAATTPNAPALSVIISHIEEIIRKHHPG